MAYTEKDFNTPTKMFEMRTRQLRVRIQTLETDLSLAKHPYSRAVIQQELYRCVDEYVSRKIQEGTE